MPGLFSNLFGSFKVDIRCDLSRSVFFPGNIVEGVVIVQARAPIDFRAIRLKLAGKQRVTITRQRTETIRNADGTTGSRTHTDYHTSTAVVYKQLVTLAGNMKYLPCGNGQSQYHMPHGTFYYPFTVQLPSDLPPTMSRSRGGDRSEIYFYAKAYVDIPMGRDAVSKNFFTVIRPMPISQWGQKLPVEDQRQFHVTCCCCIDKGYVKARLFMDRTQIAIDRDNVNVYAEIDNSLGKEPVKALIVDLRAVMTLNSHGHRENIVWTQAHAVFSNHIQAGEKGMMQGVVNLPRSAIPTFTSPHCTLSYSLHAELEIPMASNPTASFPVVVAQSVDETNFTPPIDWRQCSYKVYPKGGACPEFYYQPPPRPVFEVNMIPSMPPPPQQYYMPLPAAAAIGVPNSEWVRGAAPFVPHGVKDEHVQHLRNAPPIQWQQGVQQYEAAVTTKEQPAMLGAASPTSPPMPGKEDSKGYGSIEEPLVGNRQ